MKLISKQPRSSQTQATSVSVSHMGNITFPCVSTSYFRTEISLHLMTK